MQHTGAYLKLQAFHVSISQTGFTSSRSNTATCETFNLLDDVGQWSDDSSVILKHCTGVLLCYRKTVEPQEDECECSDDDDDDDVSGRRYPAAASSSSQDTTLLHRHRCGVAALPTAFDELSDPRDFAADRRRHSTDRGHHPAGRLDSYPSSTSPVSERTLYQPFIYADGAQGVDNGLDSTTYF